MLARRHWACTNIASARPDRGAVAVEFALILPLLVMLLLGVTTSGLSYSNALGVTNAVREGARFGATADATSATWAQDVISRVRATQFDDPTSETAVCAQLVKYTLAGGPSQTKVSCNQANGPALSMPGFNAYPAVPAGLPDQACVVRVVAAREFQINIVVVPVWNGTIVRGAVARYERGTC